MLRGIAIEPSPVLRAIRMAADVVEVDDGDGFCASVHLAPRETAVVRLDVSIRGTGHEGDVMRWAMECTLGQHGHGLHIYAAPSGIPSR